MTSRNLRHKDTNGLLNQSLMVVNKIVLCYGIDFYGIPAEYGRHLQASCMSTNFLMVALTMLFGDYDNVYNDCKIITMTTLTTLTLLTDTMSTIITI